MPVSRILRSGFQFANFAAALWLAAGGMAPRVECAAQESNNKQPFGEDIGKQLPRVPGLTPEQSRDAIALSAGFQAQLVAAEPLVRDPVALDFDERGRAYVVELPPYNAYIVEGARSFGAIRLLEDEDGDGTFDKSTVFAEKLRYPSAVACWDGGVFVGDAPELLYLKDRDGDGRADHREVVLTGFGSDKAGEAHLNSLRWHFDNHFHFSTSLSGGEIRRPDAPAEKARSVRGRGLVFDPRDPAAFELTSGAGQHGMSWDDWGRKFVCSNSVPAQTLMYDDRYVARNPLMEAPNVALDIAPEGKYTKLMRISPEEPWRVLRTRLRREGKFRGSDEGGKPFGFFTGATGVTIYRGDAWPAAYRGNLLVGDVANNLVYRAVVEEDGLQLVARRADRDAEFLASRDIWFRPVQFAHAPDGTLYLLDMCRELIEGAAFLPPEFFEYLDAESGNDRGRIYRLAPPGFQRRPTPDLGAASTSHLVGLLAHPNAWHRDTASRLLYQRQDSRAAGPLRKLVVEAAEPLGRMTALYSLAGLQALDEATLLAALGDRSPQVRAQALRVAESHARQMPAVRDRMLAMVDDAHQGVRYQLAFSLGALASSNRRNAALAAIARELKPSDRATNSWMQVAIQSAAAQGAEQVLRAVTIDGSETPPAAAGELRRRLATQIGAAGQPGEVAAVIKLIADLPASHQALSKELVEALVARQKGADRQRILAAAGGKASELLEEILVAARRSVADTRAALPERVEAVRNLRLGSWSAARPLLETLLDPQQPQPLQVAALDTAGSFSDVEVAQLLLRPWRTYSPAIRSQATELLLSRTAWTEKLLDAVADRRVQPSDLDPNRVSLLKQHRDSQIAKRVAKLFADIGLSDRGEVVERYQQALELAGDAARGKLVFKQHCAACHQLEGVGTAVGADLKAVSQRGLASVLLNILDPNREVKPKFLTYVLVTDEGRTLTGMITDENANSLALRQPDGKAVVVQRVAIEQLASTGKSFMPEGLEKQVDPQAMADLLAYLDSFR